SSAPPGDGTLVLSEQCPGGDDDIGLSGEGNPLQALVVGCRHLGGADPGDGSVEIVKGFLVDARGHLGAHAVGAPALLEGDSVAGLLDGLDHWRHVEWA